MIGILLMAGEGKRFGGDLPKQFCLLGEKRVYQYALETFVRSELFEKIILVVASDWIDLVNEEVGHIDQVMIVEGGKTRQESTYRALLCCPEETENVLIHCAARPFVSERILRENIESLGKFDAINTCIPSSDTIVEREGMVVKNIPLREKMWRGQTPQSFKYQVILKGHQHALKKGEYNCSDDAQLALKLGYNVGIVEGEEYNFKITELSDLKIAECLVKELRHDGLEPSTLSLKVRCSTN